MRMNYDIEFLKQKIENIERRLNDMEGSYSRSFKTVGEYGELLRSHCTMNDEDIKVLAQDIRNIFERIRCLEFHAYPGLARDIVHIANIIGEGAAGEDPPPDRRKP